MDPPRKAINGCASRFSPVPGFAVTNNRQCRQRRQEGRPEMKTAVTAGLPAYRHRRAMELGARAPGRRCGRARAPCRRTKRRRPGP
jgi:hypothetical protein